MTNHDSQIFLEIVPIHSVAIFLFQHTEQEKSDNTGPLQLELELTLADRIRGVDPVIHEGHVQKIDWLLMHQQTQEEIQIVCVSERRK